MNKCVFADAIYYPLAECDEGRVWVKSGCLSENKQTSKFFVQQFVSYKECKNCKARNKIEEMCDHSYHGDDLQNGRCYCGKKRYPVGGEAN